MVRSLGRIGFLATPRRRFAALLAICAATLTFVIPAGAINPAFVTGARVRMFAQPHLIQINTGFTGDFSLLLSNNHATGGTCFGDSGGPNFLGTSRVIAGVTSFGLNGTCGGTGGVFRVDRRNVLDFVNSYLD